MLSIVLWGGGIGYSCQQLTAYGRDKCIKLIIRIWRDTCYGRGHYWDLGPLQSSLEEVVVREGFLN